MFESIISQVAAKRNRLKIADCRISPDVVFFFYPLKLSRVNIHPRKNLKKQSIIVLLTLRGWQGHYNFFLKSDEVKQLSSGQVLIPFTLL